MIQKSGIIINDLSDHFPVYICVNINQQVEQNQGVEKTKQQMTCFNYRRIEEMKAFLGGKSKGCSASTRSRHNC